jgi:cytochrome c peroxidase
MSLSRVSISASLGLFLAGCGVSGDNRQSSGEGTEAEQLRAQLNAQGIQPLPDPPAISDELFELGQALFFDKILSGSQDVSCATCHLPSFYTGDGRTLPNGVHGIGFGPSRGGGAIVGRNSPNLFHLAQKHELFWDGRVSWDPRVMNPAGSIVVPPNVALTDEMRAIFTRGIGLLAAQALLPVFARNEMRGYPGENDLADLGDDYTAVWAALLERLLAVPGYVDLLRAAYPGVALGDFHFAHAANAIAGFEARAFSHVASPFERFTRGDDAALSSEQLAGAREFFGPAGCNRCHSGSLFTDQQHHNIGLPQLGPGPVDPPLGGPVALGADFGRMNVSSDLADIYAFRTPSLLAVALTGPYGHAGQFANLRDFVQHYQDPEVSALSYDISSNVFDPELVTQLVDNTDSVLSHLDPLLANPKRFDVDAVVGFLNSLTPDDAGLLDAFVPDSVPSGLPVF